MAKRNFNGSQINQSVTIAEQAGAAIDDVRNLILKYDENGDVVVATDGTAPIVGIAILRQAITTSPEQSPERLQRVTR